MSALTLHTATLSSAGGRADNQDVCAWRDGCWVLADGLGGHAGGAVAARIAVDHMLGALTGASLPTGAALTQAITGAHQAIQEQQASDPRLERMRTTLVVLCSDGERALWAHVGDSRLYHFRGGRLCFQTADHSVPQVLARAGEIRPDEIRFHEDRNRLLRTLGNADAVRPTVLESPVALTRGDAFLLCTDGFWEYVTEPEMELTLAKSADPDTWLRTLAVRLLARAEPGNDNYTAAAVFVT